MATIECRDVVVEYGQAPVVKGFNGVVGSGQWLGVIGPNGAGKSSLLKAIVGITAFAGTITVDGESLAGRHRRRRATAISYVPQEPLMPADMSVFDYVLLGRSPYVSYFGTETSHDREMAAGVLDRLELGPLAGRLLGQLSGGERQRVVIARALATEAPILVLDEPTSALDIGHQQQAMELVARLRREQGLTVISALHDLTLAGLYCDRLVLLHEGAVAAEGRPGAVLQADTLAELYGVRVTIHHEPDGTIAVIPRRASGDSAGCAAGARAHHPDHGVTEPVASSAGVVRPDRS